MEQMEKMDREEQMEQEEPRGAIYILQTNRAIGVIGEQVAEQFGIKSLECNLYSLIHCVLKVLERLFST